jgi:nicotinate dehydrogenase subunit B
MTDLARLDRQALLDTPDTLLVLRPRADGDGPDIFIAIGTDGGVVAFNGHVDLGTGIGTALAQIVAEELDVPLDRVSLVLGHTAQVPDQGPTIASETIQVTAVPLRLAAATARHFLLRRAAERLGVPPDGLTLEDGTIRGPGDNAQLGFGELIVGHSFRVALDAAAALKPSSAYRLVGQPVPRRDIPAKATGSFVYVHDVRVAGMLHGRVVCPPYAGRDSGDFVGTSLIAVDESSIADVPGVVAVVVIGDFVGVVAEREEQAVQAAQRLKISWRAHPDLPDLDRPQTALRTRPSTPRVLHESGDVDAAIAGAATGMNRSYAWPYQMHASIGPSCAVADYRAEGLVVWSGTQNPLALARDLALLLDLPESRIEVVRHEAAGCYGRNCADDVSADAALLSRACGRPVRVQLSREQEHAWEPKGAAQVMDVAGGLDASGHVVGYDFTTRYPSNGAPTLALLLTGIVAPVPLVLQMGDRTAVPPYAYDTMRVTVHDMAPIVRASWLRGVSALPNSFAHESWIDECAIQAGVDPIAYRLRYLRDARAAELVQAVAERAKWVPHTAPFSHGGDGDVLYGRGFAYAVYVHGKFPGTAAAWSAWVADVAVNRQTGEVAVTKVIVGQDTGQMINPDGVRHQIHGNVIQSTSRALTEQVRFDRTEVVSREWGGYPILTFPEIPVIDVVLMPRPNDPPLGAGESASVPSAAAIANAIFDATGVRMREPPFTPERMKAALAGDRPVPPPRKRRFRGWLAGAAAGALGMAATILPWRPAYAPIPRPDAAVFSAATIERGRMVAAAGACAVCHTGPDAARYGGGLALDTPFGRVWSTNISPDAEAGIGGWSYPAFERAMREGISRDGHFLYPAHPYTSFAGANDADLQALYAFLMSQPAVATVPPATRLAFPFGFRPLMAAWNALFLRQSVFTPDATRSADWNRGAYLVETLGHCGACHTERNLLGAEKTGAARLAGGFADGWEAPPLTALSHAPVPWSAAALFDYLRTGFSPLHGVAAGPMAPVVASLADLPDADIRAMAAYLATLAAPATLDEAVHAAQLEQRAAPRLAEMPGARLYEGACAVCHDAAAPPQFGARPSLALNSSLHSGRADNLLRVMLDGIATPVRPELGTMPGFAESLSDGQLADLANYLRARFAPDRPAWTGLEQAVARLRAHQSVMAGGGIAERSESRDRTKR